MWIELTGRHGDIYLIDLSRAGSIRPALGDLSVIQFDAIQVELPSTKDRDGIMRKLRELLKPEKVV